jgi:hypothetical protein
MAKAKDKSAVSVETLRPYVKRAIEDPDLRDDLLAAVVAARSLYSQVAKRQGVRSKAEKVAEKDFQRQLQDLVSELSEATDRLQGKAKRKSHRARNRVILLTGVTLGVLYNPWTGPSTREWIMKRVAGGDSDGLEELEAELAKAEAKAEETPAEEAPAEEVAST